MLNQKIMWLRVIVTVEFFGGTNYKGLPAQQSYTISKCVRNSKIYSLRL